MARKGDIELEIPWWLFLGLLAGGYLWYRHSTAPPSVVPYPLTPNPWGLAGHQGTIVQQEAAPTRRWIVQD